MVLMVIMGCFLLITLRLFKYAVPVIWIVVNQLASKLPAIYKMCCLFFCCKSIMFNKVVFDSNKLIKKQTKRQFDV